MIGIRGGPVVFAIEDDGAQLSWRHLPQGDVTIACGPSTVRFESDGGPGLHDIDGLLPGHPYTATISTRDGQEAVTFRTLPRPAGEELFRFATMSDLHLGRTSFGVRHTMREPDSVVPHPIRCGRSAIDGLLAWGAQRVVVKGDFVDSNSTTTWELARQLMADLPVPWSAIPGNHELAHGGQGAFQLAADHGVDLVRDVEAIDVPGLRLVLMNSAIEDVDVGRWGHLQDATCAAVGSTTDPAMLLVHHHPQAMPIPTHFPPGIDSVSARRFLLAVQRANPRVMGTSGHTHRHRFRTPVGIPWSEVGSTKDFPGTWAGYVVHEGGVRQVVRRVADPGCLEWLDRTRHAAGGLWALWSPGRLTDRCFTHMWPSR